MWNIIQFLAADSLVPGKIKWLKYTPIACEDLIGLEDAGDFNSRRKPWLEIAYTGSCPFDSIKPLDKGKSLTRPCLEARHYEVDLTQP